MDIFKKACLIAIFLTVLSSLSFAQTVIDTIVISNASYIAINPETNLIYVTGNDNSGFKNFISVIDGDTNKIIETINIEGTILAISINTSSNRIYVSNIKVLATLKPFDDVSFISVIDGDTNEIIDTVGLSKVQPTSILANQITNKIYAAGTKGFITKEMVLNVIDGETNEIVDSLNLSKGFISSAAINQKTNRIYVEEILEDRSGNKTVNIGVLDGETNDLIDIIEFGEVTTGEMVVNEVTDKIYLSEIKNFVSVNINDLKSVINVIDGTANEVIDVIKLDSVVIQRVTVNSVTNRIYAGTLKLDKLGFSSEFVEIIDGENNNIVGKVDVGNNELPDTYPLDIAVNPVTNRVYTSIFGGLVRVIQDK